MTTDPRDLVVAAVRTVAPDVDEPEIVPEARLQQDLGLDSMDHLDVMTELSRLAGVEIPERDYGELLTVQGCIDYLARHRVPG